MNVNAEAVTPISIAEIEQPYEHAPSNLDWRAAIRSSVNAGAIGAILSAIPVGPTFVLGLPLAGFLSVILYRRSTSKGELTPKTGFRLGAGTGFAAFIFIVLFMAVQIGGLHAESQVRASLIQLITQVEAQRPTAESREALEQLKTPEGLIIFMLLTAAFACLIFAVLGGVGGAVSASFVRRKNRC